VFGKIPVSRGYNQSRDFNVVFQHDTTLSQSAVNQFRFQYARRGLHFGFSQQPGGSEIGVNIPGFAYFGREPYSTVDRIERRTQFTDTLAKTWGHHTFKFGADANLVQLRSARLRSSSLISAANVNFGGLAASTFSSQFGFPSDLPGLTGAQAYGLGIPTTYIQGIGNSNQPFDNSLLGFSARIRGELTAS